MDTQRSHLSLGLGNDIRSLPRNTVVTIHFPAEGAIATVCFQTEGVL